MLFFAKRKAQRIANEAWEILKPGYVDSPVIRYRIEDGNDYIDIILSFRYQIKIVIGDELNGDRITLLDAFRITPTPLETLGEKFIINEFHSGDWTAKISETLRQVQADRKATEHMKFDELVKVKAKESFTAISK